jgi:hypothetical protein
VGAGASAEFGLPTGAALMKEVSDAIDFEIDNFGLVKGDRELFGLLKEKAGGDETKLKEFLDAARDLRNTMGSFVSMDEALHYWSANSIIVQLGKVTIANTILKAERNSKLFQYSRPRIHPDLEALSDTWLSHAFSMALSSLKREQAISAFQKVTFINFNYDRTIERYLSLAFSGRAYVWEKEEGNEVSDNLNIIRPYGSVGRLHRETYPPDVSGVRYGQRPSNLFEIATNIRTFAEQHQDRDVEERIEVALTEAVLVVFLGFGFHKQNIEIMRPKVDASRKAHVIATVLGIDEQNHAALQQLLYDVKLSRQATLLDRTASKAMSDLRPKIMMIAG